METPRTRSYLLGVAADNVTRNFRERHIRELIYSSFGSRRVDLVTANTTLTDDHDVVLVNATAGPVTITIPDLATTPYKTYLIRKVDTTANPVTITAAAGTIDALHTKTFLLGPDHTVELVNPGLYNSWYTISNHPPLAFQMVGSTSVTATNYTTVIGSGRGSRLFPADYFRVGDTLHLFAQGYFSAITSNFIQLRWMLTSGDLLYGNNDPPVVGDYQIFTIDFYATCLSIGAAGTFQATGRMTIGNAVVGGLVQTGIVPGINTTITQQMDLQVRHSVAGLNDFKTQTLYVEVLR